MLCALLIIILIIFNIILVIKRKLDLFDGVILTILEWVVLFVCLLMATLAAPREIETTVSSYNIVAAQDNQSFSQEGHLKTFLLIGISSLNAKTNLEYTVLIDTINGYLSETYDAKTTYLKYDDENPRVEKVKNEAVTKKWWNTWIIPWVQARTTTSDTTTIYIPSDSIIENYEIDLQ